MATAPKPITTGNTLLPPPRLVGDASRDTAAMQRWLQDLYDHIAKTANVLGSIPDLNARVAALEAAASTTSK